MPASNGGGYLVVNGACGCPDHGADRDVRCKHLHAIDHVKARDGAPPVVPAAALAKPPAQPSGDLTVQEQGNVRAALRFLRIREGGAPCLGKALRLTSGALRNVISGRTATASLAVKLARFAGVPVDDLISGRWPPPGTCAYCGRAPEPATPAP